MTVEVSGDSVEVLDGATRRQLGQLAGRSALRFSGGNDGTPDRVLASWVVNARAGTTVTVTAAHDRAGRATAVCTLG